ncbi:hypothetical protein PVL29_018070 [Vitis rotundifolia]|uniref:Protein kinase domain-containing protein n=1 Tax=Vitis rotundifolia TaxID=103349 RepID=A0AA38Z4N2_VITRO|nr:hypothetical protein PVL29_018070 [Vitis rotundifolia]
MGNMGLCGGTKLMGLHPCEIQKQKHKKRKWIYYLFAILTCSLFLFVLIALTVRRFFFKNRSAGAETAILMYSPTHHGTQTLTEREIEIATGGFDEANLLGKGSFGRVYKAIINDGKTVVAVKVLQEECIQGYRSFKRECQILSEIRHRNLVRMIGSTWNSGFKAIVLEYIGNGNLEQHLYPGGSNEGGSELKLRERMGIAIDILVLESSFQVTNQQDMLLPQLLFYEDLSGISPQIKIVIVGDSSLTMKKGVSFLVTVALMALASSLASAFDPRPLQDTCVAIDEPENAVFVNGKFCKNPNLTVAEDFLYQGLNIPGNTSNYVGSIVNLINVDQLPGENTLGVSLSRIDYEPNGQNPPHFHPRASEIFIVLKGKLLVGFITSNPEHRFISKVLNKGDVFVFPFSLIHFQVNIGHTNAVAIAAFNSQNPGLVTIASSMFGSNPPINPDFLARAFQLDKRVAEYLEARF